jgi:AcrR family transcriptional regulator
MAGYPCLLACHHHLWQPYSMPLANIWIFTHICFMVELMKRKSIESFARRQPRQRRARQTVEAMLDAVVRILKREGVSAVTTNRIAEVAGVSIGSVYQYFRDKNAIYVALHQRHIEEIDRLIERTLIENAALPLDHLMRSLIEAMLEAHAVDPQLYEVMSTEVPHRPGETQDFAVRLHGVFRLAIASRIHKFETRRNLDKVVFVVANMVDSLSHAVVLRRPLGLSLVAAKEEAVRAVLAYLNA